MEKACIDSEVDKMGEEVVRVCRANSKIRPGQAARAVLALLAVAGALVLLYHCPFRALFGVACPGCGMTRALLSAVFSDFKTAFAYHPLFPLLIPAALWIGLRLFGRLRLSAKRETPYILLFAGVFFLVYIVRLCSGDPVVAPDVAHGLVPRLLAGLC